MSLRNKPLDLSKLITEGNEITNIPLKYFGDTSYGEGLSSSFIVESDMSAQSLIASKVYSLEQQSYQQVLCESNTGHTNGYITTQEFKGASDAHYVYAIPLSRSWTGSLSTNKMPTRKASAGTNTTNEEKYVQTSLDVTGAYFTPWDYTYIDHIDVGISLGNNTLASDYASGKFYISIYAGGLSVDEIYNEPATWFAINDGLGADMQADVSNALHKKGMLRNKTPFTEHASVKIRPLSTTLSDYNGKYFYLSDGKGNRCKFTFNSSIGSSGRTGAHDYYVGLAGNTTLAAISADIKTAINTALQNSGNEPECSVFAKVNGDNVDVYNIEAGDHGNQIVENNVAVSALKFTTLSSTDEITAMTGGVSADPVNQIIGNEAFPLAAFSNNPLATRNEAHAPASVSFENLNHSGESTVGTGLYHLGKINTSQVIEFPASLGMTTGFMAVAKIPVKMIFRYAGTPIIAGIKYAGTVPADLDSDGGATDTQNINTQARVYGGKM